MLPPVDKVPNTDYLLAQNWRVDSLGRLVSRAGYPQQFSIAGAGIAHSAANAGGVSDPLYVASNSGIVNPTGSLYYDGNPTPIATGFDGNRVGFAAQNGFMWAMNRGNQGRHSPATGWQPWNLSAPPASPTVAAGSAGSPSASATYTYTVQGTTIASSIAAGLQTVTPASMTLEGTTPITVGGQLCVSNAGGGNYEVVTVTAITASTFSAVFATGKTGPGILVGDPAYVHVLTIAGFPYYWLGRDSQNRNALYIALLTVQDPNCSVTYPGTGDSVVIAPILPNTGILLSGSDGNTPAVVGAGSITNLPDGTYQFYLTFLSADLSIESNPSPASAAVTVANQAIVVTIPAADAPVDARIGFVNIYATGGTLGSAYQVGQVPSTVGSPATTFTDTLPDLQATDNGVVMPTQNDPPPAASGMIGPQWSRLFAWSTVERVNRLFYTPANQPQYWPGSGDPALGNWVDVGLDNEAIIWCTLHTNLVVIYKQRSIWMLIGDPSTGTLEQVYEGPGLAGQWALTPAGGIDFYAGPNGLYAFDMNVVHEIAGAILPIFNQALANAGNLTSPGGILAGSAWNSNSTASYAVALGYAMGKLYLSYAESGSAGWNLLVYNVGAQPETDVYIASTPGKWFYHRNASISAAFTGFFFDGVSMTGLCGTSGGPAQGFNLDDFRGFLATDPGANPIECVYQSHYEDCGLPDNQKMWLEVAVDYEFSEGAHANVYAGFDSGNTAPAAIGNLLAGPRATVGFTFPAAVDGGVLARNISVLIDVSAAGRAILHNVYLYYYVEARLAVNASSLPTDLGVGKVKQCKELELDIDATGGPVAVTVMSDLPGNALAVRQTPTVGQNGRAIFRYPFAVTEGYIWKLIFKGPSYFRLYSARLLMRAMGTYVEAYESAAGFVWDSMEMTFDSGVTHIPRGYGIALAAFPVKRAREISLEIDTFGANVTLSLLTDLPGNAQTVRFTCEVNSGLVGRRFYRIPLPQGGTSVPVEGRIYRLQFSGRAKYILYGAAIDVMVVGVYIEAYEAAAGAVWDSTPLDLGNTTDKTFDELRFEIDSDAGLSPSVAVYTDLPGETMVLRGTFPLTAGGLTTRHWATVPLPDGIEGRSVRLLISSAAGFRLYRAQVRSSAIGRYLCAATPAGNDRLKTLEYDFSSERVKMFKRIEIDMRADGVVNLSVITNQSGRIAPVYTPALATPNGRETLTIALPPGVRGRLLRLLFTGTAAARIYHIRVWMRPVNDPKAQWTWEEYPLETSDVLPSWGEVAVAPTPADWFWAKVLAVEETPDTWTLVDVPFEVAEG